MICILHDLFIAGKDLYQTLNKNNLRIIFSIVLVFTSLTSIIAGPSGGPYGPIQVKYVLPEVQGETYFVAPDGKSENSGLSLEKPTSLEAAISKVLTGDAIILRGGVYRTGGLLLNQGITIQPYEEEKPVFKGTFIADNWRDLHNGLWITSWKRLFPSKPDSWWRRFREGIKTPLHRFNNDMVFIDGKFLQSAGWEGEVDENSYFIDYDNEMVYIGTNPAGKVVEITAYNSALVRTIKDVHGKTSDGRGPVIKGITFTQYAYRAIEIEGKDPEGLDPEDNHGKDVVGSVFENCTISFCSRVGGFFRGDKMVMRNCKISDTSTEGVYLLSSSDCLLEKNIFTRNNIERITGYYPAAVKIFNQTYRVTCNDNLIIDLPYSNGIWYDVGNVDGVFTNNWVENVGGRYDFSVELPWPSDNGFFFEISKGAVCAGNIFINCDHGVWALNSSNVSFYNNTFINSTACIARNARGAEADHFGWHPGTGPGVDERTGNVFVNNLLVGDENFNRPLLYIWQPDTLCGMVTEAQVSRLDYNSYVRPGNSNNNPLIIYTEAVNENCKYHNFMSPGNLNQINQTYSKNSSLFENYRGPLFKSAILNNYFLLKDFPAASEAGDIPDDIKSLIGFSSKYVGAFPPDEK